MDIIQPTLLVDKERALTNIRKMAEKVQRSGVRFRPHFKTHQSKTIGEWFKQFGVTAITVSSLDMAGYFAKHGWDDITVAFPVNLLEIHKINALANKIQLNLLAESQEAIQFLSENLAANIGIWLKIDVGYHRTGIPFDRADKALELAKEIHEARYLQFAGLLTHAGHSYNARSLEELKEIHYQSVLLLNQMRDHLQENGITNVQVSIGDTPTCKAVDHFVGVDEIRPGNFIFHDLNQWKIGSCQEEDIAVAVACPVVAKHPERKELIIYGGAVHFSKDFLMGRNQAKIFGHLTEKASSGWGILMEDCYISSLSQEHGIVKVNDQVFDEVAIGDVLTILPVHSCLTVNLLRKYLTTEGQDISC